MTNKNSFNLLLQWSLYSGSFGNLWLIKSFIFEIQKWIFVWSTRQSRAVVVYPNGPRRNLNWTVPNIVPGELHTLYYYCANQARALFFPANWYAYTSTTELKQTYNNNMLGKISLLSPRLTVILLRSTSATFAGYYADICILAIRARIIACYR